MMWYHYSSVAQLDCDLTMHIHPEVIILILALTLDGQVHAGKIIGGHEVKPHSRPYLALLKLHMPDGKTSHCSGFLLNEDFVMTAAHCQACSYTVLLGVHNVRNMKGIQNVTVERTFPHKDFNGAVTINDIMLLKLSSKAIFSKNVKPIALAGRDDGSLPKSCIVSGWGRTSNSNPFMSLKLMEINVTLIDNEWYPNEKFYFSEGENGPASGDSGGPLVCEDGRAYGVVSSKMDRNSYSLCRYTRIPDYRDWIDSITKHHGKLSDM